MRYTTSSDSYHMFVGSDGEERWLYYHVVGDSLELSSLDDGDDNRIFLKDISWDMKYLYSNDLVDYDFNLTTLFFGHVYAIWPDFVTDGNGSSSLEGD